YTNERTVSDVWIDGKRVVKGAQVLTMARPDVNQMEQFRRRLIKFKKEEASYDGPKLDTPEAQLAGLGRWELVRQLSVLLRGVEDADVALAAAASNELPAKRKQIHSERLATAWRKQYKALSSEERDFSDVDSDYEDRFPVKGNACDSCR
ncbi:hypothetical protein FOZ62_006980, partial [Perkinsus olseni]